MLCICTPLEGLPSESQMSPWNLKYSFIVLTDICVYAWVTRLIVITKFTGLDQLEYYREPFLSWFNDAWVIDSKSYTA